MLSEAIQSTLQGVITNTSFAMEDEEILVPFCVHREVQRPDREKKGVAGYEYDVEILIIDNTPEAVASKKASIRTALEALEGTTVSSTSIELVDYKNDDPAYDEASRLHTTVLFFIITTSNI